MQQFYGPNADQFTKKNISQAAPIVEQAKSQATINHNITLKAEVKVEAGTADEAIRKLEESMNSKIFDSFNQSLREAQSTYGDFAR